MESRHSGPAGSGPTYSLIPLQANNGTTKTMSAAWRYSPKPNITNEARFGFNLAPGLSNMKTPYVQEWQFGIQHQIKATVIEARYVGGHATRQIRGIDYNQVIIDQLLPDFLKARNNGLLAQKAGGSFDPRYNPGIAGSQQLKFFAQLPVISGAGGSRVAGGLTNSTIVGLIQTGQAGELANTYQINGNNGNFNIYPTPLGQGRNLTTNFSNSTYNGLQLEVRHPVGRGFRFRRTTRIRRR